MNSADKGVSFCSHTEMRAAVPVWRRWLNVKLKLTYIRAQFQSEMGEKTLVRMS